jgi:hypothetical protein
VDETFSGWRLISLMNSRSTLASSPSAACSQNLVLSILRSPSQKIKNTSKNHFQNHFLARAASAPYNNYFPKSCFTIRMNALAHGFSTSTRAKHVRERVRARSAQTPKSDLSQNTILLSILKTKRRAIKG